MSQACGVCSQPLQEIDTAPTSLDPQNPKPGALVLYPLCPPHTQRALGICSLPAPTSEGSTHCLGTLPPRGEGLRIPASSTSHRWMEMQCFGEFCGRGPRLPWGRAARPGASICSGRRGCQPPGSPARPACSGPDRTHCWSILALQACLWPPAGRQEHRQAGSFDEELWTLRNEMFLQAGKPKFGARKPPGRLCSVNWNIYISLPTTKKN